MTSPPLRVAQWATGNIGMRALREVLRHPALELAGVFVYDEAKEGVDAGELCGEPACGVLATRSPDSLIAVAADCVLYMPRRLELEHVTEMLASGTNVVTTRGEFVAGAARLDDGDRARVRAACEQGRSSIYATGSSPGFITDALPLALLSMQRHVEAIVIDEFANMSQRDSPHMLFSLMGFGAPLESFDPRRAQFLLGEFSPALGALADAANTPVDDWSCTGEVAAARETTKIAAGEIRAGTIAAQRTIIEGRRHGTPVVRMTTNWYCTTDVEPSWALHPTGWRVRIQGDAPFDVALPFPVALEELGSFTPAYTANRPVNAIPYVCAARPGILTTLDLPPITAAGPVSAGVGRAREA